MTERERATDPALDDGVDDTEALELPLGAETSAVEPDLPRIGLHVVQVCR